MGTKDGLYLKIGFSRLRRYQAIGLDVKIRYTDRMIEAGLELTQRQPAVAWSGGSIQPQLHMNEAHTAMS